MQTEAARTTIEASKQIEEVKVSFIPHEIYSSQLFPSSNLTVSSQARSSAAQTRLEAANQQALDIRTLTVSAASAAAEAAVKSAVVHFRVPEKTPKDRTSDSYTDYGRSERTSSYTKTQSSRSVTDGRGKRSRPESSAGPAYTSDEFDSYMESRQDRTQRFVGEGKVGFL